MKTKKQLLFMPAVLILATLACNLPAPQQPVAPVNDLAATITAQAATIQAQSNPAASDTPAKTATPTDTPMPTETPTITLTPTPAVPMVTVSQNTNCRIGPGLQYNLTDALNIGQSAEVIGKYGNGGYWIIKPPGSSGTCWLWGQYATVTGDTTNLPEYSAPPTPTPARPEAPKAFKVEIACTDKSSPPSIPPGTLYSAVVTLSWTDAATNEDGYHLISNNRLLETLPPDSTSYSQSFYQIPANEIITYGLEAFNTAGASARKEKSVSCP